MAWATPQHFENTKIIRTFDLKSPIAHEESGIRAKNIAAEPVSDYYFYLPGIIYNSTASITASLRKEKTSLTVTEMEKDVTK
jgi:oligosaccharyltransferase complex subunit alpha (ribophorin I)